MLCLTTTLLLAWGVSIGSAAEQYSYADLIGQLTNLERLAVLPAEGETCKLWSSWDRKSQFDEKTGKYVRWDGNRDVDGFIRNEPEGMVMAEMEGPGCIWRIWSATVRDGWVKIYLDGSSEPAVNMAFNEYFSGKRPPFQYPMLSYKLSEHGCEGQNLYMPIPYQKSCKIVAEPMWKWGEYFQFTYTTFPKGTTVPTFSTKLAEENAATLVATNGFLQDKLGNDPASPRKDEVTLRETVRIEPGQTARVAAVDGARAITAVRLNRPQFANREDEEIALRQLALKITFDDAAKPQVWCPLGDFFGTAPGWNLHKTLATGMTETNAYALWYMPFASKATVELVNDSPAAREISMEIVHAPLTRAFNDLCHFHTKWHRETFAVEADRRPDWSLLRTQGRGRFVACMLHVWNPLGGWWGEGDEKFFVDGEKFPSTFGTGSEDYFGYAWCHPGLFQRPFHAQTMSQNNAGHQSVLRWQIADNVPFQRSFDGYIENYKFNDNNPTAYAATVGWYLAPGGDDPYEAVPASERRDYYTKQHLRQVGGYKLLGYQPGELQSQNMESHGKGRWENDDQVFWSDDWALGGKLELAVPVATTGTYDVAAVLTRNNSYAIVQLYLDDQKLGEPIDLYAEKLEPTEPISLGTHPLTAGEHKLTIVKTGHNPKAAKRFQVGFDRLIVTKKP
jgi:hypothetical protein